MSENVTPLGDLADAFDESYLQMERDLDNWIMSLDQRSNWKYGAMAVASLALATGSVAKGFIDPARVGNGMSKGTALGAFEDTIRLAGVMGPVAKLAGKGLKLISLAGKSLYVQQGKWGTCFLVSAVNGVRRSGQRAYMTIQTLAEEAGLNYDAIRLFGTMPEEAQPIIDALRRYGVAVTAMASESATAINLPGIVRSFGSGVTQVSIFVEDAAGVFKTQYHTLLVQGTKNGMRVIETTGPEFASIEEYGMHLAKMFPPTMRFGIDTRYPMLFYKNAALGRFAETATRAAKAVAAAGDRLAQFGNNMTSHVTILLPVIGVPESNSTVSVEGLSGRSRLTAEDFGFEGLNSRAGGRNPNPLCPTRCH